LRTVKNFDDIHRSNTCSIFTDTNKHNILDIKYFVNESKADVSIKIGATKKAAIHVADRLIKSAESEWSQGLDKNISIAHTVSPHIVSVKQMNVFVTNVLVTSRSLKIQIPWG
jgi:hypothetical protein